MVIGFGRTEKETALKIIRECIEAWKTDGPIGIERLQSKYVKMEKQYDDMSKKEAPERYTYFWADSHKTCDGNYIIEFEMNHINRRHPLSPDGWAMFTTNWLLKIDVFGDTTIYQGV